MKEKNNLRLTDLLMTYYFPVYSTEGKCKIDARKSPRKFRLMAYGFKT